LISRCIGVWDTVGAYGLPEELVIKDPKIKLFGFNDPGLLGAHVQYAFQALALDERRKDFVSATDVCYVARLMRWQNCNKFRQTTDGQKKGQVLRQASTSQETGRLVTDCGA
jgi:hypothetical protein